MIRILILTFALSACGGEWISRREAYEIATKTCEQRKDADDVRGCKHMVDLRHGPYWQTGSYPNLDKIPRPER